MLALDRCSSVPLKSSLPHLPVALRGKEARAECIRRTSRPRFLAIAAPPASARSAAEPAAMGYCQHSMLITCRPNLSTDEPGRHKFQEGTHV